MSGRLFRCPHCTNWVQEGLDIRFVAVRCSRTLRCRTPNGSTVMVLDVDDRERLAPPGEPGPF